MEAELNALQECVDRYERAVEKVLAGLRPGDGFLGLGNDPRRAPCHMEFYTRMEEETDRLKQSGPSEETAFQAVRFLLSLSQEERYELAVPMMEAVQGHALALIPLLAPAQAEELAGWYGTCFPKRRRLPVQTQVFRALERRAKGG